MRRRLERLAWILDSSIRIPGTQFRIGLDGLIGLLPGIGDWLGALISAYIIAEAAGAGTSRGTLLRMLANVLLETVVGTIPLAGDVFDFVYKANERNVRLLEQHTDAPAQTSRRSWLIVALLVVALVAALVGLLVAVWQLLAWITGVVTG